MNRSSAGGDTVRFGPFEADLDSRELRKEGQNLYRLDLRKQSGTSFIKLASSTRISGEPDFSPDGKRIVFVSSRSGSPEIWVCDRDGQNLVKLTSLEARELAYPRWSPDGRQIGFSMRQAGGSNTDIFTIRADGGELKRLTGGRGNKSRPAWSPDGGFAISSKLP